MRLWPFRGMIMRGGAAAAASAAAQGTRDGTAASARGVPQEPLFHFGEATMQRQALDMTNRLTGCAANDGTCSLGVVCVRITAAGHHALSKAAR